MATEISSKENLESLALQLQNKVKQLEINSTTLKKSLTSAENYDGIDVINPGQKISNNIDNVITDLETVTTNIKNYISEVIKFDINDFKNDDLDSHLEAIKGNRIDLPGGLGTIYTFMGWQSINDPTSTQYKLREETGMHFDKNGFGKIGTRYVVATTKTFGNVGDYIDVMQSNETTIKCIIGDIKNQEDIDCNEWGHQNGDNVIEFIVDKNTWFGTKNTVIGCHPEWNQGVSAIINKGNYYKLKDSYSTISENMEDSL